MDIEVQKKLLKSSKLSFQVSEFIFQGCFKTKVTLNNILKVPATIAAQFKI